MISTLSQKQKRYARQSAHRITLQAVRSICNILLIPLGTCSFVFALLSGQGYLENSGAMKRFTTWLKDT